MNKSWGKVKTIAERSDVSARTVRTWLKEGLPYSKVRGTILIKFDQLDVFLESYSVSDNQIDSIVTEVLRK
ncbi:MAG: helix-turn-helix domain-containing protein [Thermodesulfobacteriota bacterium]|nr:helix-turn-helix domain-containing protein [Thermodesulfobacteriota bacterium]